jgi:hypothetical protein
MPSQRVIALRPLSLYYTVEKLVALDELRAATYINWRTPIIDMASFQSCYNLIKHVPK